MNDMPKNLTVEQKYFILYESRRSFAADVAHACITMYVWDDNPKFLYLSSGTAKNAILVNCLIKQVANCAVMRAFSAAGHRRRCALSGKREPSLGLSSICVFILFKILKENVCRSCF